MSAADIATPEKAVPVAGRTPDVSVIIVSFNTREVLRQCLQSVLDDANGLAVEIIVVDNASTDGSPEMVELDFPQVVVVRSEINLGFGEGNNVALRQARGRYFVLLNSDAFFVKGALALAIQHMDDNPSVGLGGCRLIGRDGSSQPSSRCFHSVTGDAIVLSGLAAKFPRSKFLAGSTAPGPTKTCPRRSTGFPAPSPSCGRRRSKRSAASTPHSSFTTRRSTCVNG